MIKPRIICAVLLTLAISSCDASDRPTKISGNATTKNLQDTCDNPDADPGCAFVNVPSQLTHVMRIVDRSEKGEPLVIAGQLKSTDGKPMANVMLYAYQTDITGEYTKKGDEKGIQRFHGRLHGWCRTNANGEYEIRTIRPASYPGGRAAAHIHVIVKTSPGARAYYINDIVFSDDPIVNDRYKSYERNSGGSGIVTLQKKNGVLHGRRDIIL